MPPKGASNFWYVHISLHKNGLHFSVQLCQYFRDISGNKTFSGKIGINRNTSEKNRRK